MNSTREGCFSFSLRSKIPILCLRNLVNFGRSWTAERPHRSFPSRTGPLHQHRQLVPTAGTPQAQVESNTQTFCHASRTGEGIPTITKVDVTLRFLHGNQTHAQSDISPLCPHTNGSHAFDPSPPTTRPTHLHHVPTLYARDGNTWSESALDTHRVLMDATVDTTATDKVAA